MEISKLVDKIEKELATRSQALDARESALGEQASGLEVLRAELDKKASQIASQEADLEPQLAKIAKIEAKLKNEKDVAEEARKTAELREQSGKDLRLAQETLNDANLKLKELAQRETALSEKEASYREEIRKEFVDKFLAK